MEMKHFDVYCTVTLFSVGRFGFWVRLGELLVCYGSINLRIVVCVLICILTYLECWWVCLNVRLFAPVCCLFGLVAWCVCCLTSLFGRSVVVVLCKL